MPTSPYPFLCDETLSPCDFIRFEKSFSEILLELIPTAQHARFYINKGADKADQASLASIQVIDQLVAREQRCCQIEGAFYFLFRLEQSDVLATVCQVDELVLQRAEENWLQEVHQKSLSSWRLKRQIYVDATTNLLNQNSLRIDLKENAGVGHGLLLVDLPQNSKNSLAFLHEASLKAENVVRQSLGGGLVYYLGGAIFAVLFPYEGELAQYGERILSYLRREGARKAHIGMCALNVKSPLQSAFKALEEAYVRGSYSFCDYETLLPNPCHPLAAIPHDLERDLLVACRRLKQFSLVVFDEPTQQSTDVLKSLVGEDQVFVSDYRCYLLLPNVTAAKAHQLALQHIEKINHSKINAGISFYPHARFTKKAVLNHAQKALYHTRFYGPATATIFDSTSLNISGDVYYSEGNYIKACKEYRSGCQIDKGNINILNSLGATLALMGKPEALKCFEKVLTLDSTNFMALYNKGLHYLSRNQRSNALDAFEQARVFIDDNDRELRKDVMSRLGILYALDGRAQESLDMLLPLCTKERSEQSRLAYYIGKSFFELKEYKEASPWLQRASSFMVPCSEVYSLLGYVYYKTGQGKSSVSLSRKAVAIETDNPTYKLRLAEILFSHGVIEEATEYCRQLLRTKSTMKQARSLLSAIYLKCGETAKYQRLQTRTSKM